MRAEDTRASTIHTFGGIRFAPHATVRRLLLPLFLVLLALPTLAAPRRRAVTKPDWCGELPPEPKASAYAVRYDQLGYLTGGEKWTLVLSAGQRAPRYQIVTTDSHCVVDEGVAGPRLLAQTSRAGTPITADFVDLSAIAKPGSYTIVLEDGARFGPINVGSDIYDAALPAMLKFLAVQRCGPTTKEVSLHGACHLFSSITDNDPRTVSGDGIEVPYGTRSYVTTITGTPIDVEGGWHDAADYLKFTSTTSFTLAMQLFALREHPSFFRKRGLYDPMRAEMRWGLDWLRKMVDRGEPLVQVGGEGDHDRIRLPEDDTRTAVTTYEQRPAVRFQSGAGRNLLARSAAAFAIGAEVYAEDDDAYARSLRQAGVRAYEQALARTAAQSGDPSRYYRETTTDDDMALAASALFRITGETRYRDDAFKYAQRLAENVDVPVSWYDVSPLAVSEAALLFDASSAERRALATQLRAMTTGIVSSGRVPAGPAAAFRYALTDLGDGSTAQALGAAMTALALNRLGFDENAVEVARSQLHWIFGQNPFGLSFMIGVGTNWPANPHHQIAALTKRRIDGALVGGPSAIAQLSQRPSRTDAYAKWSTDEVVYTDVFDEYVTNEPAIDFIATLPFVIAELEE
jgi:endoglucanase